MDNARLKPFAQIARIDLIKQIETTIAKVLNNNDIDAKIHAAKIEKLKEAINKSSKDEIVEKIAYTWFNRFVALRYMDLKNLNPIRIVSPSENRTQPQLLEEAKNGNIQFAKGGAKEDVIAILNGTKSSNNRDLDAYRILFIAACNSLNKQLPFMFEKIDDYADILLPHDLLSENSVLSKVIETLDVETCENVEVIGWLYQYYISAKKDKVFEDIKKKKIKVTPENIPAVTQLFTPHWIVKYLVENSLGRLWMLNNPTSNLVTKMEYYIKPESAETEFLRISSPEEIKICDPACGSGHMLTYAFDLLYEIYAERGYENSQIPSLILKNNLFGIEIDDRAGSLASFALSMKACERDKRFLGRENKPMPNICTLQNILFHEGELNNYMDELGANLFTNNIKETLHDFREAKNFGSLIRPHTTDVAFALNELSQKDLAGNLLLYGTHKLVLKALKQADYLSPKYHVVIANPPYMGGGNANARLTDFLRSNYPDTKSDLFAAFIERGFELVPKNGYSAMVTMQSWMFLSSYEKMRQKLLTDTTIITMTHMANMVMGIAFGTNATVWKKSYIPNYRGQFSYVDYSDLNEIKEPKEFPVKNERLKSASSSDFNKIPGSPIAYWVSEKKLLAFKNYSPLHKYATPRAGMITGNNELFVRFIHEVNYSRIGIDIKDREEAKVSQKKWFPYQKGGPFRKWFGNLEYVVDFENDGYKLRNTKNDKGKVPAHAFNEEYIFKPNVNWSAVTSSFFSCRITYSGNLFDASGSAAFPSSEILEPICGFLNSKISTSLINAINPTLNFQAWEIGSLPINCEVEVVKEVSLVVVSLANISKSDWDSFETSWDFTSLPLLSTQYRAETLAQTYSNIRAFWQSQTDEMKRLEEENNRIFIDAYGLNDELTPDVPLKEITINCNPNYRYGDGETATLEGKLLFDTIQEFIHYAVGNMFGRYSMDKDGLILANQGEGLDYFLKQIPEPKYMPDSDNVLPIFGEGFKNWFSDDIATRFNEFLRISFGDEKFTENLAFIENTLADNKAGKNISEYFQKSFYNYHVRRFKKRPIYWQFESPKGSFKVLIYMHRYRRDQVSIILNDYLNEYHNQIKHSLDTAHRDSANEALPINERAKAERLIQTLMPILNEIEAWERETLRKLAEKRIEIDLDDGVKVNYQKFGGALAPIKGLADKE